MSGRGHDEDDHGRERSRREGHGAPAGDTHAGEVHTGEQPDEAQRQQPALGRRHLRTPEAHVVGEERGIHGHVHEAVEPAPPADLEAPEGSEGATHPGDITAFLGQRGAHLRHGEGDGRADEERREHQQQKGQPGTED
jgi:hypothetical protein